MKKITTIIVLLIAITSFQVLAQQKEKTLENRQEKTETLTEAQKEKVKTILLNYDSSSLTAEDANAIHKAFREAGLRGGPAAEAAIREAGFNPDKLRDLAPPPDMKTNIQQADKNSIRIKNKHVQKEGGFAVKSAAVKEDGSLSSEFTGDGRGVSMPLEWTNIPAGTKYFALNLWHFPNPSDPNDVKSYWVVYNIPVDVNNLPENVKGIGEDGYNDKNKTGYDPMKSKGPGVKEYNLTIYALSAKPKFNTSKVYRADLLKAVEGITLDECTLTYTYERGKNNTK